MTISSPSNFGDQLRYGFVSHLIDAFERYGIMFFIDKDEQRGKDLTNLFVRMKESKIALVIFSSSLFKSLQHMYAESSWCMDELVNIKKRAEKGKLEVIPIFYKVRAKDVRAQTGKFGDKFWALAKVSSGDQIKKWKDALECISNKMGFSEADFIKGIVKEVERVRTATVRGGAQSHHCIKFIPNKRIKICKKFPEDEAKSVEIAHMNFSNARGEEEQNQEVLRRQLDSFRDAKGELEPQGMYDSLPCDDEEAVENAVVKNRCQKHSDLRIAILITTRDLL
ncbi:hypothetical protein YC2023_011095 [Brassica napus]